MKRPKKKATARSSSGSSATSRRAKRQPSRNYDAPKTAWLLDRTVDLTACYPERQVRWAPKKRIKNPSQRLLKACRLFEFIENELSISTKEPVDYIDRYGKKRHGQLVPFHFNAVQLILSQDLALSWNKSLPFRRLIPKGRQLGVSTWTQGVGYGMCLGQSDYKVALIAHDDAGASEIFGTSRTFEKSLHPDLALDLDSRQESKMVWVNRSTMWIGSIKTGDGLGKGPRLSMIHFSEAANFEDKGIDAAATAVSIQNALAGDHPDAIIVYESTAKGRDAFFHKEIMRAQDPRSGTENKVLFLPWYLDPAYSMTWSAYCKRLEGKDVPSKFVATESERVLRRDLSRVKITKDNYRYRYRVELTDEQLIWRRFKIANECFDKTVFFCRYYPSTLEEAFSATVRCLFPAETINAYARMSRKAAAVGNPMEQGYSVQFAYAKDGWTRIWKHPLAGDEYVLGADVGGEQKGSDPCAAYVVHKTSLEVVAAVHGFFEYDHYADYLCLLGRYFNNALLMVENNHNPAVAKVCFKNEYPNLYHYQDEASIKMRIDPKPGFNTNRKTRPEIIAYLDKVTRDRMLKCYDRHIAKEMEEFVWSDKHKGYRAPPGKHDDRLMALAILLYCCPGVADNAEEPAAPSNENWAYRLYLKLRDEEDHEEMHGEVLVL